tara:strand:+ start:17631 stop:18854 length:1224 start_codon:yes stop_codon:yes gene_type:complete
VLAAVFTLGLMSGGIFSFSNAIFFGPIKQDLLLTSAQTSLIFALARAEGSIAGPIVGRLVDKFGARSMIISGGLLASLGFMLLHWIDNYWVFVIIFVGVVSTGKSAGLGQTLLSAVNLWFIKRRALAMSICITGFSSGGAVLLPLITIGVHTIGWRDVMLYSGLFMLIIVIPLGRVVRHSPESMGLEPDGEASAGNHELTNTVTEPVPIDSPHDFLVREALRTREYWILLAGSVMRITLWGAISVHGVEMMVWHGMAREAAGFMFSLMFLLSIPTRLIAGYFGDKLPLQPFLCMGMVAAAMACVSLLFLGGDLGVVIFVLLMAVEQGCSTLNWVALGNYFGRRSFATLMGIMSTCFNIGMLISPIYAGVLFDRTHTYTVVLFTFIPIYVASGIFFLLSRRPRSPVGI